MPFFVWDWVVCFCSSTSQPPWKEERLPALGCLGLFLLAFFAWELAGVNFFD